MYGDTFRSNRCRSWVGLRDMETTADGFYFDQSLSLNFGCE